MSRPISKPVLVYKNNKVLRILWGHNFKIFFDEVWNRNIYGCDGDQDVDNRTITHEYIRKYFKKENNALVLFF
jgi:hypothetical protein